MVSIVFRLELAACLHCAARRVTDVMVFGSLDGGLIARANRPHNYPSYSENRRQHYDQS